MTSHLSLPIFLLLCVSVHACTARSLISLTKKDTPHKELDEVKLLETLSTASVKDYKVEENQPERQKVANNEIINTCESCSSVSSTFAAASGTSSEMDSLSFLAAKDERRHGRSMLGHVEERAVTNASDTAEDIVEMDYAQPHRKPPIHNEKP